MKSIHIDIVSDVACPWCAIGYKRLQQAMEALDGEIGFTLKWHAFRLSPDMPAEGEPIMEHLCRKYGRSPEEMEAAQNQIIEAAQSLGLNFSGAAERLACNTTDAHRLLTWAREHDLQTALKLALFEAYFGRAENVSDPDVLRRTAESVGLDGEEAAAILASDRYLQDVIDEERQYKDAGISAVPGFVVDNRYLISGAQEPATLIDAFRQIAAEAA